MSETEDKYIKALLTNDREGLKTIYKEFLPKIESIIRGMGGSKDDAWEIFQEALIVIMAKASKPNFVLTSSFYTFLVSICKFKWYNESKKKYKKELTLEGQETLRSDENLIEDINQVERYRLFKAKLNNLKPACRKILELFFNQHSLKEITALLNLTSENAAKQKKHQCQKKLIQNIKSDTQFKELL